MCIKSKETSQTIHELTKNDLQVYSTFGKLMDLAS